MDISHSSVILHWGKHQQHPVPCGLRISGHQDRLGLGCMCLRAFLTPWSCNTVSAGQTPPWFIQRQGALPSTAPQSHPHHPEKQGDQPRLPAELGNSAGTQATKRGNISRVSLPAAWAAAACLRAVSSSPTVCLMMLWLVNPDKPFHLPFSLPPLWIALVSSRGEGNQPRNTLRAGAGPL